MISPTTLKLVAGAAGLLGILSLGIYVGKGIEKASSQKVIAELNDGIQMYKHTILAIELKSAKAITEQQIKINKVANDANEQIKTLEVNLGRAESASVSLRDKAKRIEDQYRKCASAPKPGTTAPEAGYLLANMLGRLDEAAGEFAEYADRLTVSNQACVAAYNSR